ncbi:GNAT family N-acetyltransferase [Schleiferilactobacillus shenzhenensis]|uniref:Putative acetyltransferase n=1 Tax=Schleiferilactobacillus shenzhenensis LY-73 TaxID=1231336 RepID=U4THL1_9LACO|nr:GNAT family N-acetyltransferase [Schleiferilactobacillus shenzhenensis]ERL63644.1 putative acetyltransferase [Schleiferilactobacillus shenzhenensis LY-73]
MAKIQTVPHLTPAQTKRIAHIWLTANEQAHSFIPAEYWEKNQAVLLAALPAATVTIATDDAGQILGFAGMQDDFLAGLFITASARRQGLGTQLMTHLQQQHDRITLQVYKANQPAYHFYASMGFTIIAEAVDPETNQPALTMQWVQAA